MNLPPDFEVPDGFRLGLSKHELRGKRLGRLWLEARCLFNRERRAAELVLFEEFWKDWELDSIATRLAVREIREKYDVAMALWAATLRFLPPSMRLRAEIYQLNAEFVATRLRYQEKLGLRPRNDSNDHLEPR